MLWQFDPAEERACGALTESEEIEIALGAIPEGWKIRFEEFGGAHQTPLTDAMRITNGLDVANQRRRQLHQRGV